MAAGAGGARVAMPGGMRVLTHRVLPNEAKAVKSDVAAMTARLRAGDALNLGDSGKAVAALQRHLKAAGVYAGAVSGAFDDATAAAVAQLQQAKGLESSGVVGGKTLKAIKATNLFVKDGFDTGAKVGQRGSDVLRAEKMLEKLGFRPGTVDGVFDEATAKAVERYRKADHQVPDAGQSIGAGLYRELKKASGNFEHDPFRRRELGDVKKHDRLDALTAREAAKGDGISLGAKGRAVLNLEKHLEAAGYEVGTENSQFGSRTEAAVKQFQKRSGLPVTGTVDERTWSKLEDQLFAAKTVTSPAQRVGERGGVVKSTEKKLKALGLNPGKVDGVFSKATAKAVRRFQKKHHLKQTGSVGSGTMKALNEAIEAKQNAVTDGGGWGGTKNVVNAAKAIARQMGIPVTSEKRNLAQTIAAGSSTGSDHFTGNTNAYATDFGVAGSKGDAFARAVAKKYGIPTSNIGTFNRTIVNIDGKRYSLQLLWRVEGHFDHVHLGVQRV